MRNIKTAYTAENPNAEVFKAIDMGSGCQNGIIQQQFEEGRNY